MEKKLRCTDVEKTIRLFTIQGWILDGVSDRLIVKQILQQWSIGLRQAERYVKEAYSSWSKIEGVNIEMKRELKIAKLKQDIRSLKSEYKGTPAGIQAIMAVEKELIKLEGLELPKQIHLQTNVPAVEFRVINGQNNN